MEHHIHDFVIRSARIEDLNEIEDLAFSAQSGMTFLPKNREVLKKNIISSQEALNKSIRKPNGELYFFVLEDIQKKKIAGTCAILSRIGCGEPFYTYEIQRKQQVSKKLGKITSINSLNLKKIHQGPTELCGLYLRPEYREKGVGRLLSLSRFLFIKSHSNRFEKKIIAEIRGVSDENGVSPFWEAVGRHFFEMDFSTADMLSSQSKMFIEELVPKIPICINILPKKVQEVIGKAHMKTWPALKLLQQEGFELTSYVDIFDAGPKVLAHVDHIRVLCECKKTRSYRMVNTVPDTALQLICSGKLNDFRVCCARVQEKDPLKVEISDKTAEMLKIGDEESEVFYTPFYPEVNQVFARRAQSTLALLPHNEEVVKQKVMAISNGQKHQYHAFLRRFSEWYKSVVITSKVDG